MYLAAASQLESEPADRPPRCPWPGRSPQVVATRKGAPEPCLWERGSAGVEAGGFRVKGLRLKFRV